MATKTASVSGLWSNTATWGGSAVPVDGDAVVINSGVTVTFDVDQSGFTNGLASLAINGILNISPSAITCLKMNGNITGTGTWNMGTSANPIQRPNIGSNYRFHLLLNSTAKIGISNWTANAWTPILENSTLSSPASANATTIVLNDDMGLQQGDQIFIGCGSVVGMVNPDSIYTVSAYNSSTKTVTLTSGLLHARLNGDYVVQASRPIYINRTSGVTALDIGTLTNLNFTSVYLATKFINSNSSSQNNIFSHSTFNWGYDVNQGMNYLDNTTFNYCSFYSVACYESSLVTFNNCYFASADNISNSANCIVNNCYGQNIDDIQFGFGSSLSTIIKNCIFKNSFQMLWGGGTFINCQSLGGQDGHGNNYPIGLMQEFKAINCVIQNTIDQYHFNGLFGKMYNCLISQIGTAAMADSDDRPVWAIIQSFDHNQLIGNYQAWCKGGNIITQTVNSVVQPGKLTFQPASSTYPVFKDYIINAPANRTVKFKTNLMKDTANILFKLQIIDPANDPLIDTSATPLIESTAQNMTNNQQLGIAYKSTTAKQLILRVYCLSSSGNVNIDVKDIEQMLSFPNTVN